MKNNIFPTTRLGSSFWGQRECFLMYYSPARSGQQKKNPRIKRLDSPFSKKINCDTLNNNLPSHGRGLVGLFLLVHCVIMDFSSPLLGTKDGVSAPHLSISFQRAAFVLRHTQIWSAACGNFYLVTAPLNSKVKGIQPFQGEVLTQKKPSATVQGIVRILRYSGFVPSFMATDYFGADRTVMVTTICRHPRHPTQ